jgi:uncharacterized protein
MGGLPRPSEDRASDAIQGNGAHEGSHAIRDAVVSTNPRLHLCGHIHHAWGTSGIIGECRVRNLGPTVNRFVV